MGLVDPERGLRFCTTCRAVFRMDFARCPNDGGKLETSDVDPLIGVTIANYVVDAHIGSGAMGRVYRCHHVHLQHKQFALKVLHGDLAATMAMRLRFTQEAESASRLVHPNVVSVTDFGCTDVGLLYIAMELVEGEELSSLIKKRALSPRRTVRIARQLCLGLAHAHELGFVHRDFKPDNIIIVRDGDHEIPRIVDFGLAIHADPEADSARLTTAGAAVGTPVYAAPEQMSNEEDVDHRADLFALGVTMFEMLAGRIPFDGNMLETMHLNATADRPTIAARSPGTVVPPRLEALVQKLMSRSRADRPASTGEVVAELELIDRELEGQASLITQPTLSPVGDAKPERLGRRKLAVVFALGVTTIAVAAVAIATGGESSPTVDRTELPSGSADGRARVATVDQTALPSGSADGRARVATVERTSDPVAIIDAAVEPAPIDPSPTRGPSGRPVAHPSHPKAADPVSSQGSAARIETPAPTPVPEPKVDHAPDPVAATPTPIQVPARPANVITTARLTVDGLSVRGALTAAQIKRALDRATPMVRACYGPAVTKAGKSPSIALRARFEIDESQHARSIQTTASDLPGLSACVTHALGEVRAEAAPDVGTVDVTFVLQFVPEGS